MKRLLKKPWFWLRLVTLVVAALYVFPVSCWRIIGWAKGESFYRGRPTSYWRAELLTWKPRSHSSSWWNAVWENAQGWMGLDRLGSTYPFIEYAGNAWEEVDPDAVSVLSELVLDEDVDVAVYACRGLWHIGQKARAAVPVLVRQLEQGDQNRLFWAAFVLARVQPDHPRRPIHVLLTLLQEQTEQAVMALGRLGPVAKPSYHVLFELWQSERYSNEASALFTLLSWALLRIDPEAAAKAEIDRYPHLEVDWP